MKGRCTATIGICMRRAANRHKVRKPETMDREIQRNGVTILIVTTKRKSGGYWILLVG